MKKIHFQLTGMAAGFFVLAVLIVTLFTGGCGLGKGDDEPSVRRVIPPENVEHAHMYIIQQMEQVGKMTSRNDDEDYDEFLAQANRNALELYGRDTLGMWNGYTRVWRPYALCSKEERITLDAWNVKVDTTEGYYIFHGMLGVECEACQKPPEQRFDHFHFYGRADYVKCPTCKGTFPDGLGHYHKVFR